MPCKRISALYLRVVVSRRPFLRKPRPVSARINKNPNFLTVSLILVELMQQPTQPSGFDANEIPTTGAINAPTVDFNRDCFATDLGAATRDSFFDHVSKKLLESRRSLERDA